MKCIFRLRAGLALSTVAAATIPIPAFAAACEASDSSDVISREAQRMIWEGESRVKANAAIDRETAPRLLGRLFDLETGKAKTLPPDLEAQFRQDAEYFSAKLRKEADEKRAAAEAVLERDARCPADQPDRG